MQRSVLLLSTALFGSARGSALELTADKYALPELGPSGPRSRRARAPRASRDRAPRCGRSFDSARAGKSAFVKFLAPW